MTEDRDFILGAETVEFHRGDQPDRLMIPGEPKGPGESFEFYEKEFYAESGESTGLARLREYQTARLAEAVGLGTPRGHYLDVGCGTGAAVRCLAHHFEGTGFRILGIDPAASEEEGRILRVGIEALDGRGDLPERYAYISFLDVLEHIRDPSEALRVALGRLEPEGTLIVKVPNRSALLYQLAKAMRRLMPSLSRRVLRRLYQVDYKPPHYFYYDAESLGRVLSESGFEVQRITYVSETPVTLLWNRLWGMNLPTKVAAYVALLLLKPFSMGKRSECLLMLAQRRS